MDHKDLLDAVVTGMANATPNNQTEQELTKDQINEAIHLDLVTGDTFLVDPNQFDWGKAYQNMEQLTKNENAFLNIMRSSINPSDSDEYQVWLKTMIKNLTEYMEGYQIKVDYKEINPNLSDRELVMLMAFDANNITRTMKFNTLKHFTVVSDDESNNTLDDLINELSTEDGNEGMWKVFIHCDDNGDIDSLDVKALDNWDYREFEVIRRIDDNSFSILVYEKSKRAAWDRAFEIFNNNSESSDIITDDILFRDNEFEDVDNDDEFDPAFYGLTHSELTQKNQEFITKMQEFINNVLTPDEVRYVMNTDINESSSKDEMMLSIEKKLDDAGYNDYLAEIAKDVFKNKEETEDETY